MEEQMNLPSAKHNVRLNPVCSEENVSDKNHQHFAAAKARVSDQRFIEFFDASNLKRYGHTWTHPHSSQGSISQGKCI